MHTFRKLPKMSPNRKTPDAMTGSKAIATSLAKCEGFRPDYKLWALLAQGYQSHCTGGQEGSARWKVRPIRPGMVCVIVVLTSGLFVIRSESIGIRFQVRNAKLSVPKGCKITSGNS